MVLKERLVEYRDGDTRLQGFFCHDDTRPGPLPGILVSHTWMGRDEFVERKARRLAWHGFAVLALDMFGNGHRAADAKEAQGLIAPFMSDRALLARRITAALAGLRAQPEVDGRRVAAIGFCFGGLCVLDLARSGADVRGVVSFHGLLKPSGLPQRRVSARILVLHGYDDPMAPPEEMLALARELTAAGADWQVHAYGHTVHAFTNPAANARANGMQYDANADRRSWYSSIGFLDEVLR